MKGIKITRLNFRHDNRGWLAEVLRREHLIRHRRTFGQITVNKINSGIVKGNHFHTRKYEVFYVVSGKLYFHLKNIKTFEKKTFVLDNKYSILISPNISHAVENRGREAGYFICYIDESFNPQDPDTFSEEVL